MTDPGRQPDSLVSRRRGYDRAVRVGLAVSFVVHLVLLFVLGRSLRIDVSGPAEPEPVREIVLQGPRAIALGEILPAEEAPEEEAEVEEAVRPPLLPRPQPERPPAEEARPRDEPAVAGEAEAEAEEGYLTNAEKLQPKEGDERLYPEYMDDELPEYLAGNPFAAYEGEIRARLGVMLDSLNLSEEQRRRATEWLTGEEDGEWGVSEDGIHIDGMVIPIDLRSLFQEEGPRGRESRQELRDLEDIRYHDMMDDVRQTQDERARQMRERTKEELERRLRDSLEAAQDSAEGEGN